MRERERERARSGDGDLTIGDMAASGGEMKGLLKPRSRHRAMVNCAKAIL